MKKALFLMAMFILVVAAAAVGTHRNSHDQQMQHCSHSRSHHCSHVHYPMHRTHFRLLSTDRLTNAVMRAFEAKEPLLLMPFTEHDTMFVYNSELPMGGTYKGHRGLLMLRERVHATVEPINFACNISTIDEPRGTSLMECTRTFTMKNTGREVSSRALIGLKFALGHIQVLNVVDLDYDKMMDAYRTRAEKSLLHLQRCALEHGKLSHETLDLLAENITVSLTSVGPRTLFKSTGKKALVDALNSNKDGGLTFLNWLHNHTQEKFIMSSDDRRVVSVAFAGRVRKEAKRFEHHAEGEYKTGAGDMHMLTMYNVVVFDDKGKLTECHTLINKPLTMLDEFHLKEKHGITLPAV